MRKRILSVVLCIVMLCSLLPMTALATGGSFKVNFDPRGDEEDLMGDLMGKVTYQIGTGTAVDVTNGNDYDYTDGSATITFTLTQPDGRRDCEPVIGLRDTTKDKDIENAPTPVKVADEEYKYTFTITPNELGNGNNIDFEVFVWWSEFDQFGPGENQYMIQTNVPNGELDGTIRVSPMPRYNDGEIWKYLSGDSDNNDTENIHYNEVKYLYNKGTAERQITVTFTPAPNKVLNIIHRGEYNLEGDTLPDKNHDGSCELVITIPAEGDAGSDQLYIEAVFNGVAQDKAVSPPINLRWEGNIAKWDPVEGADNYGIYLESGLYLSGTTMWWQSYPYGSGCIFTNECEFDFSEMGVASSDEVDYRFVVFATKNKIRSDDAVSGYRNTHTVTFDPNGGTMNLSQLQTFTNGMLSGLPTPVRDGYTFKGWFTADEGGEKIALNHVYTADTTIYAQWMEGVPVPTYTVEYNDGAANGKAFDTQTYTIDEGSKTPEFDGTPTWKGYVFDGWEPEVSETVTEDVVYEAKWISVRMLEAALKAESSEEIGDKNTVWKINPSVFTVRQLRVNCSAGGKTDMTSRTFVRAGETVTVNIMPNEGYKIEKITVNGINIDVSESVDVKVDANTAISIIFSEIEAE